jgi:hypothetical protein
VRRSGLQEPLLEIKKQAEFFVREVKDKRMTKNGPEFLIGWRDFPFKKNDTWEPKTFLTGSEHMVCEFQKQHELDYDDRRKAMDEKNASTALDNTADVIQEVRDDNGGDDARALQEMIVLNSRGLAKETRGASSLCLRPLNHQIST